VWGAVRLSDGRIVVATGNQLRYFDSTGRFLQVSGRRGGGPGEYQGLAWIGRLEGDTLLAWDRGNFRLTVVGPGGGLVRSAQLERPGWGFVNIVGLVPGPALLATLQSSEPVDGVHVDSLTYLRYALDGGPPDTVARLPGPTFYTEVDRRPDGQPIRSMSRSVPFSPLPRAAPAAGGFFYGVGDRWEIRQYQADGALRRLIRRAEAPARLTEAMVDDYRARRLAELPDDEARRAEQRAWRGMPVPGTMPAYEGLTSDDDGNVWVRPYAPGGATAPAAMVFDSSGVLLGRIAMPAGWYSTHIGGAFVLGVWRDPDGAEYVRLYRLIR
jgi:hypothetical protein